MSHIKSIWCPHANPRQGKRYFYSSVENTWITDSYTRTVTSVLKFVFLLHELYSTPQKLLEYYSCAMPPLSAVVLDMVHRYGWGFHPSSILYSSKQRGAKKTIFSSGLGYRWSLIPEHGTLVFTLKWAGLWGQLYPDTGLDPRGKATLNVLVPWEALLHHI